MTGRNWKYRGRLFLRIFDFVRKTLVYSLDLRPVRGVHALELPDLRDKSNKCLLKLDYAHAGAKVRVTRKLINGVCHSVVSVSYKREVNFTGKMQTFVSVNPPFSRLARLGAKGFDFSQHTLMERCFFVADMADKFKEKAPASEPQWREEEKAPESKKKGTPLQRKSEELLGEIRREQNYTKVHDQEVETELAGPISRLTTLSKHEDATRVTKGCLGQHHYRRGVYPYRTDYYQVLGYGRAKGSGESAPTLPISFKFEGGMHCFHSEKEKRDFVMLDSEAIELYSLYVSCDSNYLRKETPKLCQVTSRGFLGETKGLDFDIIFKVESL